MNRFSRFYRRLAKIGLFLFFFATLSNALSQGVQKIRIDPSQAYGGVASDYLKSVVYIPLETTKESLFGEVSELLITSSSYIIFDIDTRYVLYFDLSGRYLRKLRLKPNAYPTLYRDDINKRIKISAFDFVSNKTEEVETGFKGDLLQQKKTKSNSLESEQIFPIDDHYYASVNSCYLYDHVKGLDSSFFLLDIKKDSKLYKRLLPVNQSKNTVFCALGGSIHSLQNSNAKNGHIYITLPYKYEMYDVTKDSAILKAQFVFPRERVIPTTAINTSSADWRFVDSIKKIVRSNPKIIVDVSNIFFLKHSMFFKINTVSYTNIQSSEDVSQYNFIYDTTTQKLISFERMSPDLSTSYLPVIGSSLLAKRQGLVYSENSFYTSISSMQMFQAKALSQNKNPTYPPAVADFFKQNNRKSNPVIIKLTLKD